MTSIKLGLLRYFPALGFFVAMAAAVASFVAVVSLSRDVAEPIVHAALFLLALGVAIYLIGVGAAAARDPSGFFSFKLKPWIRAAPGWMQGAWLLAVLVLLAAIVGYRLMPSTVFAAVVVALGLLALLFGVYIWRRKS
jgi:hypothetical protein